MFPLVFRYHPACVSMTIEEAKKLEHFVCSECASDADIKTNENTFSASPVADSKVSNCCLLRILVVGYQSSL